MKKGITKFISNFLNKTVWEFFSDPAVKSSVCKIATECVQESGIAPLTIESFDDGSGDHGAAMQRAIDSLPGGGQIELISGKAYNWETTPKLPVNLDGHLTISLYGARINLTASAPRLFDINRTADYQTLRNVTIQGGAIDGGLIGGKHHIIIGSLINDFANSQQRLLNYDNVTVKDVDSFNNLTDSSTSYVNHRLGIVMQTYHPTIEGTQTNIKNILIENVSIEGGNAGILITAGGNVTGTNAYMDNITIKDCYVKQNFLPSSFFSSSNYQIGQNSTGGTVRVINCYGENAGDNGLELNGFQNNIVENVTIKNSFNLGFYYRNYRSLSSYRTQSVVYNHCRYIVDDIPGRAFSTSGANPTGNFIFNDLRVTKTGSLSTGSYVAINFQPVAGVERKFESLTINGLDVDWSVSGTQTTNVFPSIMWLSTSEPAIKRRIIMDNVNLNMHGTWDNSGAFTLSPRFIMIDSAFDIYSQNLQMNWDVAMGQSVLVYGLRYGIDGNVGNVPFTVNGVIDNFTLKSISSSTRAVQFKDDTTNLTDASNFLRFTNSLFVPASSPTTATRFSYTTAAPVLQAHITVDGVSQSGGGGTAILAGGQDGGNVALDFGNTNSGSAASSRVISNGHFLKIRSNGNVSNDSGFYCNDTDPNNSTLELGINGGRFTQNKATSNQWVLRASSQGASNQNPVFWGDTPTTTKAFLMDYLGKMYANAFKVNVVQIAPATSTSTGTAGDIVFASDGVYFAIANNSWRRILWTTF